MAQIDKKFIVKLQGKEFVTYEGLLDKAHQEGLVSIETELISIENNQAIFKATARTDKQTFTGYGDADPSNVNKNIAKHLIRMAETRAKARALRDLTNIGMAAVEELDDTVENGNGKPKETKPDLERFWQSIKELGFKEKDVLEIASANEGKEIKDVSNFSKDKLKRIYIMLKSQKDAKDSFEGEEV